MLKRALAALLSFLISCPVGTWAPLALAAAPPDVGAELLEAHKACGEAFRAASLPALSISGLEAKAKAAGLLANWPAVAARAQAYESFRAGFLAHDAGSLVSAVRETGKLMKVPEADIDALVPRYQQLWLRLREHGVTFRDGRFHKANGKPYTDAEWQAFAAKGSAALDPAAAAEMEQRNLELVEIQQLARDQKHGEAASRLSKLLDGMSSRPDLMEKGLSSLPMETTLALVQQVHQSLPKQYQREVAPHLKPVDRQLREIAARQVIVPLEAKPGQAARTAPLGDKLKLCFYGALTPFPATAAWAKAKFHQLTVAEGLRGRKDVSSYAHSDMDPQGRKRSGFYVVFADGSKRYESDDGYVEVTSKDGKTVVRQNAKTGSYSRTVDGKVLVEWAKDPKTGETKGRFLARSFAAAASETIILSPDGSTLIIASGFDKKGQPVVARWFSAAERGVMLPGLGRARWHSDDGKPHKDVVLEPSVLKGPADGKPLDLTKIPADILDPAYAGAYGRFLSDLPQFGKLFEFSMRGHEETEKSGARTTTRRQWVEAVFIRDGQLNVVLGEKTSFSGDIKKDVPPNFGWRLVADLEPDGTLKVFQFANDSVFMMKFDKAWQKCDFFTENAEAKVSEGRSAFDLRSRYEKKGGRWERTENIPVEMRGWTTWDSVKAVGSGTLEGLGTGVGVVFSPLQTALYGIEGSIWLAGGAIGGGETGQFAKVSGVYTLRQAKFNQWLGSGVDGKEQILDAYAQAQGVVEPQHKKLLEDFLDGEIDKQRKKTYGELYKFHRDDPITYDQRAYMAAQVFGLSNMAGQYFEAGKESWSSGSKLTGAAQYAAGAFVIGGEAYVEGFGFGLAAQPVKAFAAGSRFGLTAEQVAKASGKYALMQRGAKGVEMTSAELRAAKYLKAVNTAELSIFLAPAAAHGASDVAGIVRGLYAGDKERTLQHFDGLLSNAAGFMGMGVGLIQSRVQAFVSRRGGTGEGAGGRSEPVPPLLSVKPGEGVKFTLPEPGTTGTNTNMTATATVPIVKVVEPVKAAETTRAAVEVELKTKLAGDAEGLKLLDQALYVDPLTGLPNRAYLEVHSETVLGKSKQPAVAIMDMNNFGAVNTGLAEVHGPTAGKGKADVVLAKAGPRLNAIAAENGVTLGRFGGEEFVILGEQGAVLKFVEQARLEFSSERALRDAGIEKGSKEYQAILEAQKMKGREGQTIGDFTFGVAPLGGRDFHSALKAADTALGKAKDTGHRGGALIETAAEGGIGYTAAGPLKGGAVPERALAEGPKLGETVSALRSRLPQHEFAKFMELVCKDPLTQTRTAEFVGLMAPEWSALYKDGGQVSMVSARGLKLINDALGHGAGDAYLVELGQTLRAEVNKARNSGLDVQEPIRVGSKDFALIGKDAHAVAEKVTTAMEAKMRGDKILTAEQRAKVKEYAADLRGVSAEEVGTIGLLRSADRELTLKSDGTGADLVKSLDSVTARLEEVKAGEQSPLPKVEGQPDPQRPVGKVSLRVDGAGKDVEVTLDKKPGSMNATFMAVDANGQGVAVKTARYTGVSAKTEPKQRADLSREGAFLLEAGRATKEAGWPANVTVPEVLGMGTMDPALAKQIYGKPAAVPTLLMRRSPGRTLLDIQLSGGALDAASFEGLISAVRLLHQRGVAHGDLNAGNIIVSEQGGKQTFSLIDFGAAKRQGDVDPETWRDLRSRDIEMLRQIRDDFKAEGRLKAKEAVPPALKAAQPGEVAFKQGFDDHLVARDRSGENRDRPIGGCHNKASLLKELSDFHLTDKAGRKAEVLAVRETPVKGIYEIEYSIEMLDIKGKPTGKMRGQFTKTVFDPAVYSDARMIELARSAGALAKAQAPAGGRAGLQVSVEGVPFKVFIQDGVVTAAYPEIPRAEPPAPSK